MRELNGKGPTWGPFLFRYNQSRLEGDWLWLFGLLDVVWKASSVA
jgi:hypothetical protein